MKTIISLAVYFLSLVSSVPTVTVSGTYFKNGADGKSWNNRTDKHSTQANFKNYTGESFITFTTDAPAELTIDYSLKMSQGAAEIWFESEDDRQLVAAIRRAVKPVESTDKITVVLQTGQKYELRFKGEDAKGKMSCRWSEQPVTGKALRDLLGKL